MTAAPTPEPSSAWYVLMALRAYTSISLHSFVKGEARQSRTRKGERDAPALLAKDVDDALLEALREPGVLLRTVTRSARQ